MKSIRRTLVLRGIAAIATTFVLLAVATYVAVDRILVTQLDDVLVQEARFYASLVEVGAEGLEFGVEDLDLAEFEEEPIEAVLLVEQEGGRVLHDVAEEMIEPELLSSIMPGEDPIWLSIDGRRLRGVALEVVPRVDEPDEDEEPFEVDPLDLRSVRLTLARSDPSRAQFLGRFSVSYAVVLLGTLLASSFLLGAIATQSLRSLRRLAEHIEALPADGSADRLVMERVPQEVAPLVERLGSLLARVRDAVNREKSFSADVAHELHTPLAGLRSVIEVALHRERAAGEYRQALVDALAVVRQTETLTERLLELHRLDTGAFSVRGAVLDLSGVVRETWAFLQPEAERRGLVVATQLEQEVPIHSDPTLLGALVMNLLDNAVSHANAGGTVKMATYRGRFRGGADQHLLEPVDGLHGGFRVANSGCRVGPDDVPRLFARFSRGDPSRAATGRHTGLGLAVARRIAEVLGAELRIEAQEGGDFEVQVEIPAPTLGTDRRDPGPARVYDGEG